MKITFEKIDEEQEDEIIVRSSQQNPELMHALATLGSKELIFTAYKGEEIFRIAPEEIFYVEAVERNTFIYCEDEVLEIKYKLYEVEEMLTPHNFFRISKSMLVNLLQIRSFAPAATGRLKAVMKNGEKVLISRHYVVELKELLDM